MKIISIVSEKGGVSKTTTAQALIEGLRKKKYKVLAIDFDQQGNLTDSLNADSNKYNVYQFLSGVISIKEVIEKDCIKSSDQIIFLKEPITVLARKLEEINDYYDYVVIDTAPKHDKAMLTVLSASDYVIIPSLADSFSYKGVLKTLKIINDLKETNKSDKPVVGGILFTMFNSRSVLSKQIKDAVQSKLTQKGIYVFNTTINRNVAVQEAQASRKNLFEYAPKSKVIINYLSFVDEFLKVIK